MKGHTVAAVELISLVETDRYVDYQDASGRTALISACFRGDERVVKELINRGADVTVTIEPENSPHSGYTPPIMALKRGHEETAQSLRAAGATE